MRITIKISLLFLIMIGPGLSAGLASSRADGFISGYVFNYYGVAISGATIGKENGPFTTSDNNGYYILDRLPEGEHDIGCGKPGYNFSWITVTVISADTTYQNFTLTQPEMVINPLLIEQTLNPGEYITTYINILNTGTGSLHWESVIDYSAQSREINSEWLTMGSYQGDVEPFGGLANVPVYLNATGSVSGQTYSAAIMFSSVPNVGNITVPVTMTVMGNELIPPENLEVSLLDNVDGIVDLSWEWSGDAFQFFLIRRNGQIIATPTQTSFQDILENHGIFCYTVQAVYHEGVTSPAGPACIEWPDPLLQINPVELEGAVWPGYEVDVFTTLSNQGEGTLSFSFPEFAALALAGNSSVRGAGGPDDFGYVWIDNDEPEGPSFKFLDISTTGNPVFGISDDNVVGPFPVGFDFPYYGENKTQFWINSNGAVGFTPNYITLGNTGIPTNSSVYRDFIAWLWDDLVFITGTSQVFYQTVGNKLYIQFKNIQHFNQDDLYINAEIILNKNGKIIVIYEDIDEGVILNTCTVGLQSHDPEVGLQVAFNQEYLHDDLVILYSVPADFITQVTPASGTIPQGTSTVVTITYDSKDYGPGAYSDDLLLFTNDIENDQMVLENTMYVYLPGIFSGVVTDMDNDEPLNGVSVTAGPFQTTTGENGEYTLFVDEGRYDVVFGKLGYIPVTIYDTATAQGNITPVNTGLWDMNYAPGFVSASVNAGETWCNVAWSLPNGPYEVIMDDGEADDFFVYAQAGSWSAVKFMPTGYPALVLGGKFYVGDGSFPGPFLGTDFGVAVFDDDGVDGKPGTMLDSTGVTVNNSGWVSLDGLNVLITEGSFYLAMYQAGNVPFAAPIGIDSDNPVQYRSYIQFQDNGWMLSPLQDFMIRAWISGPENDMKMPVPQLSLKAIPKIPSSWNKYAYTKSGNIPLLVPGYERYEFELTGVNRPAVRDVVSYQVVRFSDFDPDLPPQTGNETILDTLTDLSYPDSAFGSLQQGWYAYGVRALFTSGLYSDFRISNTVGRMMDCTAGFSISLSTGEEPSGVEISMTGYDFPYATITETTDPDGNAILEPVWKGHYDIRIYKIGYDPYLITDEYIEDDVSFEVVLSEKKYPPTCLQVDSLSLMGNWCEPLFSLLDEDFESAVFPPSGWQNLTSSQAGGWMRGSNGSSPNWTIPAHDSFYAYVNDDAAGSESDGCCDYLVTPALDLRESEGFVLSFVSYYDGFYGQLASVEYSTDGGGSWETLYNLPPDTSWHSMDVDLSAFSGQNGYSEIWLAFHADDGGEYASGWAVDNVRVGVPAPAAGYLDFAVFLDGALLGMTSQTSWDFAPLPYGQTYTASVAARYSSGLSEKDYDTFRSVYLFPPKNLTGSAPDDAVILHWDPPGVVVPFNLLGYNIYKNGALLIYKDHEGGWEPQEYVEPEMQPGIYHYEVTGVYDLASYGFPGETGESMKEGPETVTVDYCTELEFLETWEIESFNETSWNSDGDNWFVNGRAGNPVPCAEFSQVPVVTDYFLALESYPICAVGITEGDIWLTFDIAGYSVLNTGEEQMLVQVWNWESQIWSTVGEFSNIDGSFDWTPGRINIRPYVMNSIFKIRFVARGINSANIRGWFLDNIHVFRSCTAPSELQTDPYSNDGIHLSWLLGDYNGTRELNAVNIYRSANGGAFQALATLTGGHEYTDPDSNLSFGSFYCYKVNAIWQSETDYCESTYSNEACIVWTGMEPPQNEVSGDISIYPNPAGDYFVVSSAMPVRKVEVFSPEGKKLIEKQDVISGTRFSTTHLGSGIYIVHVSGDQWQAGRRLVIIR